ncbi:hypothetical protein D3C73_713960 [compost metagenome]
MFELALQVLLRFTKLTAMAFIENEDDALRIDRQVAFGLHQIVQFLDRRDDDLVVVFCQVSLQPRRAV